MTLTDINARVMHQIGTDTSDLEEYLPFIEEYVYEGYDRLVYAYTKAHPTTENDQMPLSDERLAATLPEWSHGALADYATWCLYRNGNQTRQSRGQPFLSDFYRMEARLQNERLGYDQRNHFINIPY